MADRPTTSIDRDSARPINDVSGSDKPQHGLADEATSGEDGEDVPVYIGGIKMVLVMVALCISMFLALLDLSIVATATPYITNHFHSLSDVGWYGSAYQLASAPMQLVSGKLYTYFNPKWTFLSFFFLFELGSLIAGAANSSSMLIVGRAVSGLGMAGLQNGGLTILAASAPLAQRALLTGVIMGICQLGTVTGPLLGGAFTQFVSWRWCFYINLPLGGLVAILLILIQMPTQASQKSWRDIPWDSSSTTPPTSRDMLIYFVLHRLDLVGFVLFAGATIQLLLALEWGGHTYAWSSAQIIGLFVGAGVMCIIWLAWNARRNWTSRDRDGEGALIPHVTIRPRVVWASMLCVCCLMSCLLLANYFLPIYFQAVRNASPITSGINVLPSVLGQLLAAIFAGICISKLGFYLPWAIAGSILTIIGCGVLTLLGPDTSTGQWIGYQIVMAVGRGLIFQAPYLAIQHAVPASQVSVSLAALTFSQNLGGAILLVIGNTIFNNGLLTQIKKLAPKVDGPAVLNAGATAFRSIVPAESLPGVLLAYSRSVDYVFYLATGLAGATLFFSFLLGWRDVRDHSTNKLAGKQQASQQDDEKTESQ